MICVCDLGSSYIRMLVVQKDNENFTILASENITTDGVFENGIIIDMPALQSKIIYLKKACLNMLGKSTINRFIVGIGGDHIYCRKAYGVAKIDGTQVTKTHIKQAVELSETYLLSQNYIKIDNVIQHFILDEKSHIHNPEEMVGKRLEVKTLFVAANKTLLQNIETCFSKAGLLIDKVLVQKATALAVLSTQERKIGAMVIDIGYKNTNIAIYQKIS